MDAARLTKQITQPLATIASWLCTMAALAAIATAYIAWTWWLDLRDQGPR